MRGNQIKKSKARMKDGSIPTHAGKPKIAEDYPELGKVYPHACGETTSRSPLNTTFKGLSPRMRGNLGKILVIIEILGSIPTHAGKPGRAVNWRLRHGVYPHACGETADIRLTVKFAEGLSPRVRGNPEWPRLAWLVPGSIPTRAGKPTRSGPTISSSRVYPHACGETGISYRYHAFFEGLSPRVRGNRMFVVVCLEPIGSIPTRAGKPTPGHFVNDERGVYPHACGETS